MPKKARELSAIEVKRLDRRGLYAVGGVAGLLLQVTETGARSWVLRTMIGGRRRNMGLGGYPDVPLKDAREKARSIREQIDREGIDPIEERKRNKRQRAESKGITFDEAAAKYHTMKSAEFRSQRHAKQWLQSIENYVSPVIGKHPVEEINRDPILSILEPLWHSKTKFASDLRRRIEKVLDWAAANGYRKGDNPAQWKGNLEMILATPSKIHTVKHHPAMSIDETPNFYAELEQSKGLAAKALRFLILTATRSGDVRGAVWEEIDFENRTWTIPADRMKIGKEHRVPLSNAAVALLESLPRFENCPYVFTTTGKRPLTAMTISGLMKRMDVGAVPHGFRSTFRDWVEERTSTPHAVAEQALAHTISSAVEAAYRRSDLFVKRTKLMEQWAKFVTIPQPVAKVMPIRKVR